MKYTDKQIDDFIKGIYEGSITVESLPEDLYLEIADKLKKGLYKGFGGSLIKFGGKDLELLTTLRENIYMFSGAKTYQQVREMSGLLADAESFKDFREKALEIYNLYNESWMETEYNTAIGQGSAANQWNEIEKQKDKFPYLRYSAIIDDATSDICEPLDGTTLPVDDPFWSNYSPLNHFNCRCVVEQVSEYMEYEITPDSQKESLANEMSDKVQPLFKMNAGKDGYIFKPDHPYFEVAPKDKGLARENFNLPIPDKDDTH